MGGSSSLEVGDGCDVSFNVAEQVSVPREG
jgi:hypothetical protein